MSKITLKRFSEYNSDKEDARVNLTFEINGEAIHQTVTVEGRHKNARSAVGNAVARILGIHPDDIQIVRDAMDEHAYDLELTLKTEAWVKNGKSTIARDPGQHPVETAVQGFITALQNAQKDERPIRRRPL